MTQTYPEESVQALVSLDKNWWGRSKTVGPGSLVWAVAPYPEQKPRRLTVTSRGDDDRQHDSAAYHMEEFRVGDPPPKPSTLPVAAMPLFDGESFLVQRGKRRPCLILVEPSEEIDRTLARGQPRRHTARTRLVLPYYSANGTSSRGGWSPKLVARIKLCEYAQYFWDLLPLPSGSPEGSILRLDHAFSIGRDPASIESTGYSLHPEALRVLEDQYLWYVTGTDQKRAAEDTRFATARTILREYAAGP